MLWRAFKVDMADRPSVPSSHKNARNDTNFRPVSYFTERDTARFCPPPPRFRFSYEQELQVSNEPISPPSLPLTVTVCRPNIISPALSDYCPLAHQCEEE